MMKAGRGYEGLVREGSGCDGGLSESAPESTSPQGGSTRPAPSKKLLYYNKRTHHLYCEQHYRDHAYPFVELIQTYDSANCFQCLEEERKGR